MSLTIKKLLLNENEELKPAFKRARKLQRFDVSRLPIKYKKISTGDAVHLSMFIWLVHGVKHWYLLIGKTTNLGICLLKSFICIIHFSVSHKIQETWN